MILLGNHVTKTQILTYSMQWRYPFMQPKKFDGIN